MANIFYIDGHKVEQEDRFGDGSCWFSGMKLPDRSEVAGPYTPVEFARHRLWGLDMAWANRNAVYALMQDTKDAYNDCFWPMKECEPEEAIRLGAKYGRERQACVFTY